MGLAGANDRLTMKVPLSNSQSGQAEDVDAEDEKEIYAGKEGRHCCMKRGFVMRVRGDGHSGEDGV